MGPDSQSCTTAAWLGFAAPLRNALVALLLAAFGLLPAKLVAGESKYSVPLLECLRKSTDQYRALAECVGTVTKICRAELGQGILAERECEDLEAIAWQEIYMANLQSLRDATARLGVEGAATTLEDAVVVREESLYRSCDYLVNRWPLGASKRSDASFVCVLNATAERAVDFFFWNREALILLGEQ